MSPTSRGSTRLWSWSGRRCAILVAITTAAIVAACNFSGRPQLDSTESGGSAEATDPTPKTGGQGPGIYLAIPGDTVYGVAQRFGVPVRTLIESNGLKPPFRLAVSQRLRVPVRQEHVVQRGETLFAISRIYGVDQSSLARANSLAAPFALEPGQRLVLPGRVEANLETEATPIQPAISQSDAGGTMSIEELPAAQSEAEAETPPSTPEIATPVPPSGSRQETSTTQSDSTETALVPEPETRSSNRFLWPVQGQIISRYGPKTGGLHNDGINIAAPAGTNVLAADDGVVAYSGNELRGFGNLILIRHSEGWVTAYAHNDKLLVKRGDKVKRGQAIARIGSTGNVAAPQLHFEIRQGTDPVDPLKYLRAQGAKLSPAAVPAGLPNPG